MVGEVMRRRIAVRAHCLLNKHTQNCQGAALGTESNALVPTPQGVTSPMPVTTTRRLLVKGAPRQSSKPDSPLAR